MVLGVLFAVMTFLVMWSECLFWVVHPQMSLAALILHHAAQGYHYKYIQVCAVILLSYLSLCAYYTVFQLRLYRYYRLDSNRMTDENSLIFRLLCRLTAPMCLNFLGMIHLDAHITANSRFGVETQFTKLMGHLDVIPLIAKGINIYFPILIVLLCLGTWFRFGTRILHSLGIDQFLDDDQMTVEMVHSGKALVTLERNRLNRIRGREERNKTWSQLKSSGVDARRSPLSQFMALATSDSEDSVPIMEHGEEDDLLDHRNGGFLTISMDPPESTASNLDRNESPSLDVKSGNGNHYTPSSIFDDL